MKTLLTEEEKKARRAAKAKLKAQTPERKAQKSAAQLRYQISDKAALAHFHRWAKRRKKPVELTDEELLRLRAMPCHKCERPIERTGVCFILISPRGPVRWDNVKPTCGYCKLIKPAESFDPIDHARKTLRRNWKKTPMAAMAKQKARKAIGRYECAKCNNLFPEKEMELDHVAPINPIGVEKQSLDDYATRLYCPESNLQYLCKPCHKEKTTEENVQREVFRAERRQAA